MSVLQSSLEVEAERTIQPTLEIETDPEAQYEMLAKVLSRAKNSGMVKIAFVEPGA
jgi:biopolymer transport protein ExbD